MSPKALIFFEKRGGNKMKQCKTYNKSDSNINQNIKNIMCDEIFTLELWY